MVCMKKRINVSIDSVVLSRARELGISVSAVAEEALRQHVAMESEKKWKEENQSAIGEYNRHIAEKGVFSKDMRTF